MLHIQTDNLENNEILLNFPLKVILVYQSQWKYPVQCLFHIGRPSEEYIFSPFAPNVSKYSLRMKFSLLNSL